MKDILGYEGLYAITSCGKVWSYRSQKFIKPGIVRKGYHQVQLWRDGKCEYFMVHRLVLEAYSPIEGMENLQANHIDENPAHNYLQNLEWMTPKENINYGTGIARRAQQRYVPVRCIETDIIYESRKAAASAMNRCPTAISNAIKNGNKCAGYHWESVE